MEPNSAEQHELHVQELFDAKASSWSNKYSGPLQHRIRLFLSQLEGVASDHAFLLDFGCGAGDLLIEMCRAGHRVVGLDSSTMMIQHAERRLQQAGLTAQLLCGRPGDLDPALTNFDAIICSSVLEYLWDPVQVLQLLAKRLSADGFLLLTVPNRDSRVRKRERWLGKVAPLLPKSALPSKVQQYLRYLESSLNHYSLAEFKSLVESAGCRVDSWSYFNPRTGHSDQLQNHTGDFIFARLQRTLPNADTVS